MSQEIQIGVLDVNDSPPEFVRALPMYMDEGVPAVSDLCACA